MPSGKDRVQFSANVSSLSTQMFPFTCQMFASATPIVAYDGTASLRGWPFEKITDVKTELAPKTWDAIEAQAQAELDAEGGASLDDSTTEPVTITIEPAKLRHKRRIE